MAGNESPNSLISGLKGEYFKGYFNDRFDFFKQTAPTIVRQDSQINFADTEDAWQLNKLSSSFTPLDSFSTRWSGYIQVPVSGKYRFYLNCDDAGYLFFDEAAHFPKPETATIENGGLHGARERSREVLLEKGLRPMTILYGDRNVNQAAQLSWSSQDAKIDKQIVPTQVLFSPQESPQITVEDIQVIEGTNGLTNAVFTLRLSRAGTAPITLDYQTVDGFAKAGIDYQSAKGQVTFNPGETTQTLNVSVMGDTAIESEESFTVQFSNPTNATLTREEAIARILNDDRTVSSQTWKGPDFNGDGQIDLVWRHAQTGENLVWLMNNNQPTFAKSLPIVPDLQWQLKGTGDFDGNGTSELLWRHQQTGEVGLWQMQGDQPSSYQLIPRTAELLWDLQAVADINRDGNSDMIWRDRTSGQTGVWFMNGTNVGGTTIFDSEVDQNWQIQGAGDFNGDKNPDLLWRNLTTGANRVWLLSGTQRTQTVELASAGIEWQATGVTDMNGDRTPDILWRNTTNGANGVWFMNSLTAGISGPSSVLKAQELLTVGDLGWQMKV